MNKILLVEDDISLIDGLKYSLRKQEFDVEVVRTVEDAKKQLIYIDRYDLIILDVTLPDGTGFDICERVRKRNKYIPIIFLTASDEEVNVIRGLDCGGDDYVTKPFNILEVKARMKAILRRNNKPEKEQAKSNVLNIGDMRIDCDSRSLFIRGKEIYLTAKEFDLLELLAFNPNRVYSRDVLLKTVWGADYPGDGRTVDVHIRRLREKIEDNSSEPKYVHTKWGVGYYFNV